MDGRLTLDRDFKEFIESLNANDVRYLVVGGYAVAFHGHPRYTKDLTPDQVFQLGYPPYRIDLLSTLEGVDFDACYAQRAEADIAGARVHFIDLASLRKNKRAVGRNQDLADLENLE